MRALVVVSRNDESGLRCVDIRDCGGRFDWVECRRDPEDSHGWRPTGAGETGFRSAEAAERAAARALGWP